MRKDSADGAEREPSEADGRPRADRGGPLTRRDPSDIGDLGTADRPGEEGDEIGGAAHAAPANLMRSSAVMALGTVVSRATGFGRTLVLAAALGVHLLGDAYQAANMVPFTVYDLLIGGLLASVIVPFLVKRKRLDADGGDATEQRLFTLTVLALLAVTVAAIAAAEFLIWIYASEFEPAQREVAVALARFLLSQIFFIGVSGITSAMLNSRNRFAAPMWAPILHNITVMAVGSLFLLQAGSGTTPESITDGQIQLLGIGTAAGMAVQSAVLLFSLWRAGFRWRPRLDLRGSGLGEAVRTAGWMLVYIAVNQLGFLVTTNVTTSAGARSAEAGSGITAYQYAFQLFQLPYAIIAVSVITALLPRMSAHVADGRRDLVRDDFSNGFRMSSVLIVPTSIALAVFATQFCTLVYARGSTSVDDARNIGAILAVFALMLIPFTLFQLQLRVFYALGDTRTPALIAIPSEVVHAAVSFTILFTVEPTRIVLLMPVAYGLYYMVAAAIAWVMLSRKLAGLDGRRVLRTTLALYASAVPSAVFAMAMIFAFGALPSATLASVLSMVVGTAGGVLLFILSARLLKVTEVTTFLTMVRTRLLRRGAEKGR
ncbi:murein biosynthesis integral membrane protein MurJ [Allonocardiopsis opalescens]|uniref:Putative peptidoglycan lipid II flippase n=1 Tax=Allonocardiopsis opalescens TaxID=1144618 RepID=A0A2T0Q6Z9_9ACTN|nr:murein biosynthesis integral membrane protein MurJ [Allonocardiopsis opalescens]PRX99561.1 putative peptidoglycan lipid II flippase [Allonocardiopsis opalescens]